MTSARPAFEDLLEIGKRAELSAAIAASRMAFTLPQAERLLSHLESLEPARHALRLAIVHTYTSNLLDPWLRLAAATHGLALDVYHAPYGLALQEARSGSGLLAFAPDVTLLLLRREDLHPDLSKAVASLDPAQQAELRHEAVGRLAEIVRLFRGQKVGHIVVTLLPPLLGPGLGIYDAQSERSESAWWASLKGDLARCLRDTFASTLFLDLDEVALELGRSRFFDPRFWYSARFPFTAAAAQEVARRLVGVGALIKLPKAKVIVVDADNTLWGGIIGEDGINGIALGPEYPGDAFVEFQRRLLEYQQRGFVLALCSKNNPGDVDQVFREHPHQILRDEHFAARRVNWLSKTDNLISLAEELNLGLDSFVFVDDSPYECAEVRHKLPEVEVVQTPPRAVDVPACLEHVARLEVLALTAEDLAKTDLYAQERRRREAQAAVETGVLDQREYLESLRMRMRVHLDDAGPLARLSQLTQKTNQFNLTTRRYSEDQLQTFIRDENWLVAHFSLADVFGDSGIVGLALFHIVAPHRAELDTFLMSCRVIGREAESAFLHTLLRHLAGRGVFEISACYEPTAKNVLVKNFLPEHGFEGGENGRYHRDLSAQPPAGESAFAIAVEITEPARS